MKLFTKDINQKLFAQYRIGSNLNKQKVVAKIFNPYGEGRWYLLNSDPNDPDYLWAIVQIGDNVEIGSVSRSELERARIKPFGLPLERDTYFSDRVAIEVLEGLEKGQTFAAGGMTAGRWYKDNSGKEFRFIGESEGKLLFKDGENIITKSEEDFEDSPKEKKLFGIFDEGGETEDEGVDLFEDYDDIPKNVQKILEKYDFEEGDYRTLEKAKKDVEKVGYTFEYSLDGTAYDLRKIGEKGKSGDEYAKGGLVTLYDDYDKDAGYIIEKENKYWTGKNWSDVKAYAESYKTKQEAEKKLKSIKMAKGGLVKINISDIEDSDFQSLSQIFESNDAAFSIDEAEEYVSMDLKGLPDGNEKQEALEIIGKYDVQRMDKGGKINWGEDLGDGFSIGNDVYIKDSSSRFYNKNGYLVGKIGQRLVVQVGEDDMYAVVSKEKVEKLNAPMAKGGNINSDLSDKELKDLVERLSKEKTLDKKEEYALMKAKYMLEKRGSSTKMAEGGKVLDLKDVYNDLRSKVGRLEIQEETKDYINCDIRDWGNWEHDYQDYERDEEDFEDDDFMILSESSGKKMQSIVEEIRNKYPTVSIKWNTSEKNYIDFNISRKMAMGGSTPRTIKLTLSDKDSYDYTYKQDGATASITFGFGKEPFQYEVKKISKSLEPLKQDILDAFTIQGIKQHEYKGGFTEAINHLDTKVVYEDKMADGGKLPNDKTINGYDVSYFKAGRWVYANIEIPSPNPTFDDDTQIKGVGKDENEAFNDLKKEFEKYLNSKDNKMAKGGEVKIDKEWQKKELLELNDWHKEKIKETKSRLKEFGLNENHRDYRETFEKLDKIKDTSKKLIQSGILENGKFDIKYQFIFKSAGYPESYVALDKQIILSKPKYQEELDAYKKQYPDTYSRDGFVAEKIGDITKPILGFPLATSSGYSEGNSKIGKSFADGGDTAAAEHNIKQAKYGARLVGKQKNLDVNKNGKLDAEDFKILRGEKMAMGGETSYKVKGLKEPIQNLINYMIENKIQLKTIKLKSQNGVKEFMDDVKPAVDEKLLMVKLNPIDKNEIRISLGINGQKFLYAKGGKVKFEDKVKAVKESLLKRKKVSPKVQKDYGKTYDRKEALEAAKRIVGAQTAKYELKKKFKKGGKTIAQTPAPKKDRVFGSSKNKAGSASSKKAASNIELNESIVKTLGEKAKKYNEKHSSKVSTSTLKAVMRRGMGAYSTSHRPTITGGAPNSRQAWGFARVNKFLLKKGGTKVKAAYVQDDDLI